MPASTIIIIERHQRDGLYELVSNHTLAPSGTCNCGWMEKGKDFATAERLGLRFWDTPMLRAATPETSVNEYGQPPTVKTMGRTFRPLA